MVITNDEFARQNKCHCEIAPKSIKDLPVTDLRQTIAISQNKYMEIMNDICNAKISKNDTALSAEAKERQRNETMERLKELKYFDEKFGRTEKSSGHSRSLMEDINQAKMKFYTQRANVLKLRACEDFAEMNSFVYKATSQAIRDEQIKQREVMKQDKEKLLTKEIEQRYQQMQCDAEKEAQDIAEKDKWDKIHLQSLKSMVGEKDVERQLKRLKNQHAAMIRNNHTAYRLKRRLGEFAAKEEANSKIRALQRGVYENRNQIEATQNAEDKILKEQEKAFFDRKAEYMKKFNDEKEAERRKKRERTDKLYREAEQRLQEEQLEEEISYIRERDLADKKWRTKMEEMEMERFKQRKELLEEQRRTKQNTLDNICLASQRERMEFERVVRQNQEDFDREQKQELEKKKKTSELRRDLLCTVEDKRMNKREERERSLQNATQQVIKNRLESKYHDQEMFRELQRLRGQGLEEKYIIETMRHCNITPGQSLSRSMV